jgi:hypothetical protein
MATVDETISPEVESREAEADMVASEKGGCSARV